ncbi:Protease 3 precursor [compost metagenome]
MQKETLNNGFEIYTESIDVANTVTFSIYVKAGCFQEVEPFGVAHFVEHMVFKGTTTRNVQQINEDVEDNGGYLNAETSFEHTRYYTTIPYEAWKKGADVVCDVVLNSTFPEKEFELEKKVIQEELKMYADQPDSYVFELLTRSMFASYPNRQTIGGTVESVGEITLQQLLDFKEKFYTPKNMFAVVTGNISHNEVVQYLEGLFGDLEISNFSEKLEKEQFSPDILDSKTATEHKNIGQSHLAWGLFVSPASSSDSFAIDITLRILGGGMNSRLYRIIREERGLAYTVSADYMALKDTGVINGYAGLESSSIDDVKDIIIEEFEKLRVELVDDKELQRAVNGIKGGLKSRLDNLPSNNSYIGTAIIKGISPNLEDYIKGIESVTKEDIQNVAKKYFTPDNWQFAELLPIKE